MKTKSKPTRAAKRPRAGAPESAASKETFGKRTKKPGRVGLANEARPGLGSRRNEAAPTARPPKRKPAKESGKPRATPRGYEEPRPEPREQPSDTMAHELERSTGTSGHAGIG